METDKHNIRLIIEDHEDHISWGDGIDESSVLQIFIHIKEQLRKKYLADELTFRDIENAHYTLDSILEYEVSPIFISIPHQTEVKTFNSVEPRSTRNSYFFKDADTVKIQKFEGLKKYEDVAMKIPVIKTLNESSQKRNYKVEAELAKDKKRILNSNNNGLAGNPFNLVSKRSPDNSNSKLPTFGNGTSNNVDDDKYLDPSALDGDDMTKRQKVAGNDGKTQHTFIKLSNGVTDPAYQKGELGAYTMADVKKHNSRQDAWIVINDKVYDITQYIPFHPGGAKVLAGVGRDGTELFNKYHPWVNAHFLLAKYQVGFLKK